MFDDFFNIPEKPFFTDAEISEQQKPYTVRLKSSDGQAHDITMPLCMWDWLLVLSQLGRSPGVFLNSALEWKKQSNLQDEIGSIFSLYLAELVRLGNKTADYYGTPLGYSHDIIMKYINAESHKYYDELRGLQWRIQNKIYPIMPPPFPSNPDMV